VLLTEKSSPCGFSLIFASSFPRKFEDNEVTNELIKQNGVKVTSVKFEVLPAP